MTTRFACPVHKTPLDALSCTACGKEYPVVKGVPVLLNEANSVFRALDYTAPESSYGGASSYAGSLDKSSHLRMLYRRMVSRVLEAAPPKRDFDVDRAVGHILLALPQARILVIGAGETRIAGDVTYSDVAFGKHVMCIADAHDLPFAAQTFDACIAIAVLEHVADPYRCVDEMMRVLRPGGYVFAETPFMQPVHMRQYDFTRFTYLGHRRLFRRFDDVRSGVAGGPGTSAGQMLRYALTSTTDKPLMRRFVQLFGILATYPLRWLDHFSHGKRGAYDSASGFYFFGTLRTAPIPDRELLEFYRGTS